MIQHNLFGSSEASETIDQIEALPRPGWDHPLFICLCMAVPLRIHRYELHGGPTKEDMERARAFADELAERGDFLVYRDRRDPPGRGALFNRLADALAVMAFCGEGIRWNGEHWRGYRPAGQ